MENTFKTFQKELRNLLSRDQGKFFVVIDRYIKHDSDFTDKYVHQKSRYNKTLEKYQLNEISNEEATREYDRIRSAILDYLKKIKEVDFNLEYKDWLINQLEKKEILEVKEISRKNEEITKEHEEIAKEHEEIRISIKRLVIVSAVLFIFGMLGFIYWSNQKLNSFIDNTNNKLENINEKIFPKTEKGTFSYDDESKQFKKLQNFDQVVIEFWTPSFKTKDFVPVMRNLSKDEMEVNYKKYYVSGKDEKENNLFINQVKNIFNISGYSRYEVWGSGSEGTKPGWLWIVNINNDKIKYDKEKFLDLYKNFWDRESNIYLVETFLKDSAVH